MCNYERVPYLCGCEVLKLRPCELGCYERTHPGELALLPVVEESLPESRALTQPLPPSSHRARPAVERGSIVLDRLPDPTQRIADHYLAAMPPRSPFVDNDVITPVRRPFTEYYLRIEACPQCQYQYGGGPQPQGMDRITYLMRLENCRSRGAKINREDAAAKAAKEEEKRRKKRFLFKPFTAWVGKKTQNVLGKLRRDE